MQRSKAVAARNDGLPMFVTEWGATHADGGLDGIVCGHIHSAVIKDIDGLAYINCGDWVDSCTAIVEHLDGRLELVEWHAPASVTALPGAKERVAA